MTPYEAAMKRLSLERDMAVAMNAMWRYVEIKGFDLALESQFLYLMARDEWEELYWEKPQAQEYWAMYDATNGARSYD